MRWRDRVRQRPAANVAYRMTVGIVGFTVLLVGIVAIPYPGPGWAIVFIGLGILATEFLWAQRLLRWVKARYDRVMAWFGRQGWWVKAAGGGSDHRDCAGDLVVRRRFGLVRRTARH